MGKLQARLLIEGRRSAEYDDKLNVTTEGPVTCVGSVNRHGVANHNGGAVGHFTMLPMGKCVGKRWQCGMELSCSVCQAQHIGWRDDTKQYVRDCLQVFTYNHPQPFFR